jgi:hypothetical protein
MITLRSAAMLFFFININTGSDIQITIMLKDCNHHEIQNLIKLDV